MSGRRRLDRILDDDYLAGLEQRTTDEIRGMRDECEQEETGISFARRVLQGKLDILRAEASRREESGDDPHAASILGLLPDILRDQTHTPPAQARMPHYLVPPGTDQHRREVDQLAGDDVLANLADRSSEELVEVAERLSVKERELSSLRRRLLDRIDALQAELIRRYKAGEARPGDILSRGR